MTRVERILSAFPRDGEELVGEWQLIDIELGELQAMFDRPSDDPMYLEYEVKPEHVERLERATGQKLDLGQFEYSGGAVAAEDS